MPEHKYAWWTAVVHIKPVVGQPLPRDRQMGSLWTDCEGRIDIYRIYRGYHPMLVKGYFDSDHKPESLCTNPKVNPDGEIYPLIDWDWMPAPMRSTLQQQDFLGNPCPLNDTQFSALLDTVKHETRVGPSVWIN